MRACVFLDLLNTEYQNLHSTSKVRAFVGCEDVLEVKMLCWDVSVEVSVWGQDWGQG